MCNAQTFQIFFRHGKNPVPFLIRSSTKSPTCRASCSVRKSFLPVTAGIKRLGNNHTFSFINLIAISDTIFTLYHFQMIWVREVHLLIASNPPPNSRTIRPIPIHFLFLFIFIRLQFPSIIIEWRGGSSGATGSDNSPLYLSKNKPLSHANCLQKSVRSSPSHKSVAGSYIQ